MLVHCMRLDIHRAQAKLTLEIMSHPTPNINSKDNTLIMKRSLCSIQPILLDSTLYIVDSYNVIPTHTTT